MTFMPTLAAIPASNISEHGSPHIPSCSHQPSNTYLIWPKGNIPHIAQETNLVNESLLRLAQNGAKLHTEESPYPGICYWSATLSEAQAETLRSHKGVGGRPFLSVALSTM